LPDGPLEPSKDSHSPGDKTGDGKEHRKRLPDGPLEPEEGVQRRKQLPDGPLESEVRLSRRKRLPDRPLEVERPTTQKVILRARQKEASTDEVAKTAKRPRSVKITGIPETLTYKYIKELFESAVGKVSEGSLESGSAQLTFSTGKHAARALELFDGGSMDGNTLEVQLLTSG